MCLSVPSDPLRDVLWPLTSCGRLDHDPKDNQKDGLIHRYLPVLV